jgi:hypothetical protein
VIDEEIRRLPDRPEWERAVRIGHIYSRVMLKLCEVIGVGSLGQVVAQGKGRLFCSTERLARARIDNIGRAVSKWRPDQRPRFRVEFHYSMRHVTSDTLRSELHEGSIISIIAEQFSASRDLVVFHPLVMGGPWLTSPDPKWDHAAMWWGHEFFQNFVEDFDEFSKVRGFSKPDDFSPMDRISESAFKACLAELLGGQPPNDWGGETSDFYSAHLHLAGRRVTGAFLLKGPARFAPMRLNMLGKNNDQIVRLAQEPADVLFVQHCHEVLRPSGRR